MRFSSSRIFPGHEWCRRKSIAAGVAHTCGITTDGSVACWGLNLAGELGDKTTATRSVPRFVVLGVTP